LGDQVKLSAEGQLIIQMINAIKEDVKTDVGRIRDDVKTNVGEMRGDIRALWSEVNAVKKCTGDMRERLAETYMSKNNCHTARNECMTARQKDDANTGTRNRFTASFAVALISTLAAVVAVSMAIVNSVK
jgi:hypothetical protein